MSKRPDKLDRMPINVKAVITDEYCRSMSDADFGRYFRMLFHQWNEGSIPSDAKTAVRVIGMDPDSVSAVARIIAQKFETQSDRAFNKVCEDVRSEVLRVVRKNRKNGSLGGRPPITQRLTDGLAKNNPTVTSGLDTRVLPSISNSCSGEEGPGETPANRGRQIRVDACLASMLNVIPEGGGTGGDRALVGWLEEIAGDRISIGGRDVDPLELARRCIDAAADSGKAFQTGHAVIAYAKKTYGPCKTQGRWPVLNNQAKAEKQSFSDDEWKRMPMGVRE